MYRSAFSCISPAFERMMATCFRPFRFGVWAPLALIAFLAGEVGIGGGGNSGKAFPRGLGTRIPPLSTGNPPWAAIVSIGIAISAVAFLLFLIFAYLNARARFVLMNAAIERTCRFGGMWREWRDHANRYFGFNVLLAIVTFATLLWVGFRVLHTLITAGVLQGARPDVGVLLSGLIGPIFVAISVGLLLALVNVFAKDFLVPIMGFEGRTVGNGWERLRGIMAAEPAEFIVYIITKIVLTIVSWFARMILFIPVVIGMAIPVAVMVVAAIAVAKESAPAGIALGALTALIVVPLFLFVIALISVPFALFFESFALEFIAGRVPPVEAALRGVVPYAPMPAAVPGTPGLPNPV